MEPQRLAAVQLQLFGVACAFHSTSAAAGASGPARVRRLCWGANCPDWCDRRGLRWCSGNRAADGDHPLDQATQTNVAEPSKAEMVRTLLRTDRGATLSEIMQATGWQACSCRSFLTSQRKHRRYKLLRDKRDGISRYTLEVLG